jgi:hypothetical protein
MNVVPTLKRWKANWCGHIVRKNCLLKHIVEVKTEGRIEVPGRRGRRCEQLLDDLKETSLYWELKVESPDHTLNSLLKRLWICGETTEFIN